MELSGWGKYPVIDSEVIQPLSMQDVLQSISGTPQKSLIARGLGRSYGDSSLAAQVISTAYLDHLLKFDDTTGVLTCSAGVSLADILAVFVPKGWFLSVTPGTKFVTVGGAIASDVHGKNHHLEGSFTEHVSALKIATVSHGIIECSRELHPELFRATCGGMGLTGIIVQASIQLRPIKSAYINQATIRASNLEEALELFEAHQNTTYSVAWIDCLSTGKALGRSLLMLGEHADSGGLTTGKASKLAIPVNMPGILLNRYSIQAFNFLYYHRVSKQRPERLAAWARPRCGPCSRRDQRAPEPIRPGVTSRSSATRRSEMTREGRWCARLTSTMRSVPPARSSASGCWAFAASASSRSCAATNSMAIP